MTKYEYQPGSADSNILRRCWCFCKASYLLDGHHQQLRIGNYLSSG